MAGKVGKKIVVAFWLLSPTYISQISGDLVHVISV